MPLPPVKKIVLSVSLALVSMASTALAQNATRVQLDIATKLDESLIADSDAASIVTADRIEGNPEDELMLIGNAEVRRGGAVLRGDKITYNHERDEVTAEGGAELSRAGASFSGPSMTFQLTSRSGSMQQAEWEYAPRNLRGCAKNVRFLSGDKTTFEEVKFTTCSRDEEDWYIRLKELEIDEYDKSASGRSAVLHFKGVPVVGTPWFAFPINKERRSGFLTPSYGMSSTRGVEFAVPYYFNLAPNYDYTLTPRFMVKRGVMFENEVRVLQNDFSATVNADYLPSDRVYDDDRYSFRVQSNYVKDKFSASIDYNKVSDDDYITDFSGNIRESSEAVLPQNYELAYTEKFWNTSVRVTKNQTLITEGGSTVVPYEKVPQFVFNAYRADWNGFELDGTVDVTRFSHPDRLGGSRLVLDQQVSYPVRGAGWFVVPKGRLLGTWYQLDDLERDASGHYTNKSPSRFIPTFSLDSGLVFERDSTWFGRDAFQTLEPRVFYAYAPYRDQSDIPVFDTTIADLNFTTLFSENIFSGYDRVSEANQLSIVMSTRYIDKSSGLELFRASLGQRQYFSDQRVNFLNSRSEEEYFGTSEGSALRNDVRSDLLASVGARLTRTIASSATAQYSSSLNRLVKVNAGIRWAPQNMSIVGLSYRYNYAPENPDDNIKQLDFAMQWPLTERLYALFRYNYSLYKNKPIEVIGGFEYLHNCWTLRFAAQRYTTASNEQESNFFLQLELNGLGSIGTSPIAELRRNIKGYQTREAMPGPSGIYDYYK